MDKGGEVPPGVTKLVNSRQNLIKDRNIEAQAP